MGRARTKLQHDAALENEYDEKLKKVGAMPVLVQL